MLKPQTLQLFLQGLTYAFCVTTMSPWDAHTLATAITKNWETWITLFQSSASFLTGDIIRNIISTKIVLRGKNKILK